jgi:peptidoglycan/xylan/chitin deacetylase (PgdA/CDA1 family)
MGNNLSVVMYHYVRDLQNSRYPDIKGLDVSNFLEQILYLKKNYNFVRAEDVVESIEYDKPLPPKAVLLTFDDAYADHYTFVFPILDQLGIQGSFYIPIKAVSEHVVLDVNKIHFVLAAQPDKSKTIAVIKQILALNQSNYQLESFDIYLERYAISSRYDTADTMFIKNLLQHGLPKELRTKIVDELFTRNVGIDEASFSRELYLNRDQIMTMQRHGMHIGCHGYDHFWWNKLDRQSVEFEIDRSLEYLLNIGVSSDMWTACYPYGSYDDQAVELLGNRGCKFALTTEVNVASPNMTNRYKIPRLDTNDLPKDRNAAVNNWFNRH